MTPAQLTLDLWPAERRERMAPVDEFVRWAHETCGCGADVDGIVREAFAALPDAYDRCKALTCLSGTHRADGWTVADAGVLGVLDGSLDYHVCWDRKWAALCGVTDRDVVRRVMRCAYNDEPRFYDAGGELIATGVAPWARDGRGE
jgi:hypothetical protein